GRRRRHLQARSAGGYHLRRLDEGDDVMNDLLVARMNLRCLHPGVFLEAGWNRKVDVFVGALWRQRVLFLHCEHDVGLADLPSIRQFWRRWKILRISLPGALVDPARDSIDLGLVETCVVYKLAEMRIGWPGRHLAADNFFANRFGPGPGVFVAQ